MRPPSPRLFASTTTAITAEDRHDESSEERRFIDPIRHSEMMAGVLPQYASRLLLRDRHQPILLVLHDGATTPQEVEVLIHQLDPAKQHNICLGLLPGHGAGAEQHQHLHAFTPEAAIDKVLCLYQRCCEWFPEVNLLGVSTGALLTMLLCATPNLPRLPKRVVLISPYVAEFWSNQFLLAIKDYLSFASQCSCGVLDACIAMITGHRVDLQAQTLFFNKSPEVEGYTQVPFVMLQQEEKLIELLKQNIVNAALPQIESVLVYLNRSDIYIPPAAEEVVNAFFARSALTIQWVDFPSRHTIVDAIAANSALVEPMCNTLFPLPHYLADQSPS